VQNLWAAKHKGLIVVASDKNNASQQLTMMWLTNTNHSGFYLQLSSFNFVSHYVHYTNLVTVGKLALINVSMFMYHIIYHGCSKLDNTPDSSNYLKHRWVGWVLMEASTIAVTYIVHAKVWCQVKISSPAR